MIHFYLTKNNLLNLIRTHKVIFFSLIIIILLTSGLIIAKLNSDKGNKGALTATPIEKPSPNSSPSQAVASTTKTISPEKLISKDRITKKPFGIYVTPQNSPVSPEKFKGYHTAADFEIFDEEKDQEIKVEAVCGGEIVQASIVSGYGGLIIQNCEFKGLQSKVLYGHLDINSQLTKRSGDLVQAGDEIGILADEYSAMSGSERKHLHLGILKTNQIDYRGYVISESELAKWYDPVELLQII